jgi:predicted anti-sigma-YlaC factor YlaD
MPMITCQQLTELITDYLERRLTLVQRLRFEAHLGMCRHCRAYLDQMRKTIETLGRLPTDPIEPDVRDKLLAQFKNWKS